MFDYIYENSFIGPSTSSPIKCNMSVVGKSKNGNRMKKFKSYESFIVSAQAIDCYLRLTLILDRK